MISRGDYDVIVVGCGPVGVIAAHLLARRGLSVLVIEKHQEPYELPRAVHIDHEVMRILQSVDLADLVLPSMTMPIGAMHFGADRSVIRQLQRIVKTDRLGWGSDYFFYQPDLECTLRAALSARNQAHLALGYTAQHIEQAPDSVTVVAEGASDTLRARGKYLLGADGGRSFVRKSVGIELDDLDFDEPWVVVDVRMDGPITLPDLRDLPAGVDMQKVMFMIGDPARPTSVIPGAGRHRRWEFMLLPGESAEEIVRPARVAALLSPWIGNQRFELVRCAVYHFHALLARRWQDGRIFLLGDSAHQTPPFFGQGLCHGIRDAANLSWKLQYVLKRNAAPALLDSYLPERLPQVRGVIEASIHTGRYICTLDPNVAARRDASMRATAAQTTPGYVDIIPGLTAGILDSARQVSAPVGSRFIQPPMTDAFGARRLLDDFTGRDFVMLSLDEIEPLALDREPPLRLSVVRYFVIAKTNATNSPAGSQVLIDSTGEMLRWFEHYACRGVLLRPDAYVFGVFSTDRQAVALLASLQAQLGIHI